MAGPQVQLRSAHVSLVIQGPAGFLGHSPFWVMAESVGTGRNAQGPSRPGLRIGALDTPTYILHAETSHRAKTNVNGETGELLPWRVGMKLAEP